VKHQLHRCLIVVLGTCFFFLSPSRAQDEFSDKINSNLGAIVNMPVGSTARFANTGPGIVAGVGYNFSEHHAFVGEAMWTGLNLTGAAVQPLRAALQNNTLSGHSNLWSVTGNYRYQWQGKTVGVYGIGGGGWYYRTAGLSQKVTSGAGISCLPAWPWWGFSCVSGTVTGNQQIANSNSSTIGGNIGMGFTVKVADPSYRIYIEPRYHYAPTKNISTELVNITVGIRY